MIATLTPDWGLALTAMAAPVALSLLLSTFAYCRHWWPNGAKT